VTSLLHTSKYDIQRLAPLSEPQWTLPRHYTGSLFRLTNIVCHFLSLQPLGPPTLSEQELREAAKVTVFHMFMSAK